METSDTYSNPRHNRPILLSELAMNRLNYIMTLGVFSFTFPWKWNKETYQIEKWGKRWKACGKLFGP
jgi:hypothetical protein